MDFWEVYEQHEERVRRFILGIVKDEWVADDLAQETFVRVQANLHGLRDDKKVSSWVFSIAYNLCQDHFREQKRSSGDEVNDFHDMEFRGGPPAQQELEQRQMSHCVQNKMSLLPESLRTVLYLFDIMGFSHAEIADVLGITTDSAKVRLHRARKKLKSILEENCTFQVDERNVLICEPQQTEKT